MTLRLMLSLAAVCSSIALASCGGSGSGQTPAATPDNDLTETAETRRQAQTDFDATLTEAHTALATAKARVAAAEIAATGADTLQKRVAATKAIAAARTALVDAVAAANSLTPPLGDAGRRDAKAQALQAAIAAQTADGAKLTTLEARIPFDSTVQRLVGGSPSTETSSAQDARAEEIVLRSDSLILTAVAAELQEGADYLILDPFCSGSTCTFSSFSLSPWSIDLATIVELTGSDEGPPGQMILTRNGVSIQYAHTNDSSSLGSTLHHSAFATGAVEIPSQDGPITGRLGYSIGDLSGSSPVVSGAWTGMMAGVNRRNDDLLLGDATVWFTVSGTGGSLSASFTNITNVSRSVAHSVAQTSFSGVQVSSDGTFRSGSSGNRIQGGFYGHEHPEATSIFEQSGILGSFGTYRNQ